MRRDPRRREFVRCLDLYDLAPRLLCLLIGDIPVLEHLRNHRITPVEHPLGMLAGRVVVPRTFEHRDQRGGFSQRQVGGRLPEIHLRRRGNTVRAAAEIDDVEVELEDLILRERLFELHRGHELADLPGDPVKHVPVAVSEVKVSRQLLGDGARPLFQAEREQVLHHRFTEPDEIDAPVAVEILVFRGDERIDHGLGDIGKRQVRPVLDEKLIQDFPVC